MRRCHIGKKCLTTIMRLVENAYTLFINHNTLSILVMGFFFSISSKTLVFVLVIKALRENVKNICGAKRNSKSSGGIVIGTELSCSFTPEKFVAISASLFEMDAQICS